MFQVALTLISTCTNI